MENKLYINRSLVPGTCLVRLSGALNEDFNQRDIVQISDPIIIFDLDNVRRVTSFGVREWLAALKELQAEYYAFINCRPSVISQFNMVAHFGGNGQLITFYTPYLCPQCDKEIDILLDLRRQYDVVTQGTTPMVSCPSCGSEAEFDDVPESYFSYVTARPMPEVPPLAARLIENYKERFSIQKEIQNNVTGIWLSGPLDASARLKRAADGLEGYVVVITGALALVSGEGLIHFEKLTKLHDLKIYIARIPLELASAIVSQRLELGNAKLVSLWLPFRCLHCKKTIEVEANRAFLAKRSPTGFGEIQCLHCEKTTKLQQLEYSNSWQILQKIEPFLSKSISPEVKTYLEEHPGTMLTDPVNDAFTPNSSSQIPAVDKTLLVKPPPNAISRRFQTLNTTPFGARNHSSSSERARAVTSSDGRHCPRCSGIYSLGVLICPRDGSETILRGQVVESSHDLLLGQTAGNYQIISKIGEGGMGTVYTATHTSLGKQVAVKILHQEYTQSPSIVERFFEEARAASQLGHEHIVGIHDFGILGNLHLPFFVMDFLEGESLEDLLSREYRLPPKTAIEIILQLLSALDAAHSRGIIHRDIKPDNIFLLKRSNREHFVKLLDFGVAKLVDFEGKPQKELTQVGTLIGTPRYMSPEQAQGKRDIDGRADLYSVGVILFQMVCGETPFSNEQFSDLVIAHLTVDPPSPSSLNPSISPSLEKIILSILQKRPEARIQTAQKLISALQDVPEYKEKPLANFEQNTSKSPPTPLFENKKTAPPPIPTLQPELKRPINPVVLRSPNRWRFILFLGFLGLVFGILITIIIFWFSSFSSKPVSSSSLNPSTKIPTVSLEFDSDPKQALITVEIDGETMDLGKTPTKYPLPYGSRGKAVFSKGDLMCISEFEAKQPVQVFCKLQSKN